MRRQHIQSPAYSRLGCGSNPKRDQTHQSEGECTLALSVLWAAALEQQEEMVEQQEERISTPLARCRHSRRTRLPMREALEQAKRQRDWEMHRRKHRLTWVKRIVTRTLRRGMTLIIAGVRIVRRQVGGESE